jgi:hypothetical protein
LDINLPEKLYNLWEATVERGKKGGGI